MKNKTLRIIIIILAILALSAAGIVIFVTLRHNSNEKLKIAADSGEGLYGTWRSDYSDCVVTIEEGGKVTEFYGEDKTTAICDMEEQESGAIMLVPVEGDFYFADYYIYEVISGKDYLTSYIFLDNQELVREEYINFHK